MYLYAPWKVQVQPQYARWKVQIITQYALSKVQFSTFELNNQDKSCQNTMFYRKLA